ncbi:hypothetical protein B0H11DRAFT_1972823 [Mycena galericulata]|nr:hypothetical protein B0H11DRAFT_1972823 [Mycena galericulata]
MPKDTRYFLNLYRRRNRAANTPYNNVTPPSADRRRDDTFHAFDPSPEQLKAYAQQYEAALASGNLLTARPGLPGLVDWFRPVTTSSTGAMRQLPASRFDCTPGLSLPLCPHVSNSWRTIDDCTMKCKRSNNRWVFQCPSHNCEFIMTIPPIAPANVLLTEDELKEWIASDEFVDGDVTDSGDEDYSMEYNADWSDPKKIASASSMEEVASYLTSSPSSSSLSSFPSSSSSSISSSSPFPSPTRPSPRRATHAAVPYFSQAVADRRGKPNHSLILRVLNEQEDGYFKKHPEMHDLQVDPIPECLLPYHPSSSVGRLADLMINMTTPTGQIIRQLTSTEGILWITFLRLMQENLHCAGCNCMYSIQGYHQHRSYGRCTGSVNLPAIPECYPALEDVPFLHFRSYPTDVPIPPSQEFLTTTMGRAFVEWNGRLGVPQDVWAIITTGFVRCDKCDLVRSFEGDRAHRDARKRCMDVGQGQTSAIVKGKGREMVLYRMD